MRPTRSGAPPRLLPFQGAEFWAVRSELLVFNGLFGLLPILAALAGFSSCGSAAAADLLDPDDPIHRLDEPLDRDEQRRGVVRGGGRIAGEPEVCLVVHEHKSKSWAEDWRGTYGGSATVAVEHAAGLPAGTREVQAAWSAFRWEPGIPVHETTREAVWRGRFQGIPSYGRVLEGCLPRGGRVFLDGCVGPNGSSKTPLVRGCGVEAPVLTPGDGTPQPRIDARAAWLAGRVSLLGSALVLLLVCLRRLFAARPLAAALIHRTGRAPGLGAGTVPVWLIGLSPIAVFGAISLHGKLAGGDVDRTGYGLAYCAVAAGLCAGFAMLLRRRALSAALRAVRAGGPPPLSENDDLVTVELDATVDPCAKGSEDPLLRARHAHWSIARVRVYRSGNNYATRTETEMTDPPLVPIHFAGGAALLDIGNAVADLRAVRHVVRGAELRRGDFAHVLGPHPLSDPVHVLEARFLDPGEAIHVSGRVLRYATSTGVPVPVIGGTGDKPLVVHAGSLGTLTRHLGAERAYLGVAMVLSFGVAAATVGLIAYLVTGLG